MISRLRNDARRLFRLGLPMVVTGYSSVLMLVTDAMMVGRLGPEELAAVTPAGLIIGLLLVFGSETLTAVNTFASTAMGAKRPWEAGRHAWQGIYAAVLFGILVLAYAPTAEVVMRTLLPSVGERVLALEVTYFQICLLSVLPTMLVSGLSAFFVACERPWIPMATSVGGVLLNAWLNFALIFGTERIPAMGFAGAAWGTVISTGAQAVFLLSCFLWMKSLRRYGNRAWRFSSQRMRRLLKVGVPCGVQGALDLFSWGVLLAWLIGHFGYKHLAAQTILSACIRFSFAPAAGLGQALATLVGKAQGERDFLQAKRLSRVTFYIISTYMAIMGALYFCGKEWIMRWFTDDPEVIALGVQGMIWVAAFQYFDAMNVTYIEALQGAGDTAWPTAMQIILTGFLLVGGGLLMIRFRPEWESSGVWAVAAVYVACQGLAFRIRWQRGKWRRIRLLDEPVLV
jgi:MATE family multidrug resistance protein